MKIQIFELQKILQVRVFVWLMIACFVGNFLYHWYACDNQSLLYSTEFWKETAESVDGMEPEEAYHALKREANWYSYLAVRRNYGAGSRAEQNWYLDFLTEPYPDEDWEGRLEEYLEQEEAGLTMSAEEENDVYLDYQLLATRYRYAYYEYSEYLRTVEEQAESMSRLSVFTESDTFADANREKTAQVYRALQSLDLGTDYSPAIEQGTDNLPADGLMAVLTVALAWIVWRKERDEGVYQLLRVTRRGRRELAEGKLIAYLFVLCLLCCGLYGGQLLAVTIRYGLGDLDIPLQSIQTFRNCAWKVTIGEYLCCFAGIKLAAGWLFGSLCMALMSTRRCFGVSIVCILAAAAVESIFWQQIDNLSAWNYLKFVNLYAVQDAQSWFSVYYNLNFFTHPVTTVAGMLALIPVGFAVGTSVAFRKLMYTGRGLWYMRRTGRIRMPLHLQQISGRLALRFPQGRASLFRQEGYKLYNLSGMLFLLAAVTAGGLYYADGIYEYTGTDKTQAYRYYLTQAGGTYTQEVTDYLDEQERYLAMEDDEPFEMAQKLTDGSITQDDYDNWLLQRTAVIISRSEGFARIREQEQTVVAAQEQWGGAGLVDTDQIAWLFERDTRQLVMALVYLTVMLLGISGLEGMEYSTGMRLLNRTTIRGRQVLKHCKQLQIILVSLVLYALLYLPYYYEIWGDLTRVDTGLLLQGIPGYEDFPVPITIAEALFLVVVVRCVILVSCSLAACGIVRLVHSGAMGCFAGAAVLLLPLILCLWGLPVSAWSLGGSVLPELALRNAAPGTYLLNWGCVVGCGIVGACVRE